MKFGYSDGYSDKSKRKKIDYEALASPFMRIPKMDLIVTRSLLDLGFNEVYDLKGRSPEILFEDACKKNYDLSMYSIRYFRLAVYYAENKDNLDSNLTHPDSWA